jgi:hypothetical protein
MTSTGRAMLVAAGVAALAGRVQSAAPAQAPLAEAREVRQLVTFRHLPGQSAAALALYREHLVPIYREVEAMRTVRVFGEVESPEPLDLMVVTHYADLAAMDRANAQLRRPLPDHPPVGELYQRLSDLSLGHHDQFVELISPPAAASVPDGTLEVLEFFRLDRSVAAAFERIVLDTVHPWEQQQDVRDLVVRSETARFLIADGWDYLRTYAVPSLGAWQRYVTLRARQSALSAIAVTTSRKTMVLREIAELRVR